MSRTARYYEVLNVNTLGPAIEYFKLRRDLKDGDVIAIIGTEREHKRLGELDGLRVSDPPTKR